MRKSKFCDENSYHVETFMVSSAFIVTGIIGIDYIITLKVIGRET